MALQLLDLFETTLSAGYTAGGGTLTLTSVAGLPSSGDHWIAVFDPADKAATYEVFKVTGAASGSAIPVTGAQANTTNKNHANGSKVLGGILTKSALEALSVSESNLSLSDVTTANVTTSRHGLTPKAPNDATRYLDGSGNWSVPAALGGGDGIFSRNVYFSSSRSLGTTYQNTTGYPLLVIATAGVTQAATALSALSDASNPPTTEVAAATSTSAFASVNLSMVFFVASGNYYKVAVTAGAGTVAIWVEYQINVGTFTDLGDVAGSRSISSIYQNTSGATMFVVATLTPSATTATHLGISDSAASPTTTIWSQDAQGNTGKTHVFMVVPNNYYYKITSSGTPAIVEWREYTLAVGCSVSANLATVYRTVRTTGQWYYNGGTKDVIAIAIASYSALGTVSAYAASDSIPPMIVPHYASTAASRNVSSLVIAQVRYWYGVQRDVGTPTVAGWYEFTLN